MILMNLLQIFPSDKPHVNNTLESLKEVMEEQSNPKE